MNERNLSTNGNSHMLHTELPCGFGSHSNESSRIQDPRPITQSPEVQSVCDRLAICEAELYAIHSAHATAEFSTEGFVLNANDRFLHLLGYNRAEVVGQHHSIFVPKNLVISSQYANFWRELQSGDPQIRNFKRITKGGDEIWLKASYIPIRGPQGLVTKVIKYATDITTELQESLSVRARMQALDRAQAVIEFRLDATVSHANQVFLELMGYKLDEVINQPHRIFVPSDEVNSARYRIFWDALRRGESQSGRFHRVGNHGKEVWIQASYNPIRDLEDNVVGIVKFATDITRHVSLKHRIFGESIV